MLNTILAAVDSSAQHTAILDQAAELAIVSGAQVHVVSVADGVSKGTLPTNPTGELMKSLGQEVEAILNKACRRLSDKGVPCLTHALSGPVVQQIVDLASEIKADMIIIGHRHLGWMQRLVENSVGRDLVARSPCNVLVVLEGSREL